MILNFDANIVKSDGSEFTKENEDAFLFAVIEVAEKLGLKVYSKTTYSDGTGNIQDVDDDITG